MAMPVFSRIISRIVLLAVLVMPLYAHGQLKKYNAGKELLDQLCTDCHSMEGYIYEQSYKSWLLTIDRMLEYYGYEQWTQEEAEQLAQFLVDYAEDDGLKPPPEAAPPSPENRIVSKVEPEKIPPEISSMLQAGPPWYRPSKELLIIPRISGFIAVIALIALITTGILRKVLRRRFRFIHATCAAILFVSLALHGIIYILRFGTPSVLWYVFGAVSILVLTGVECQGLTRKKFGGMFLGLHQFGGIAGLIFAILHWIWAWL